MEPSWKHADVFPIIARVIEGLYQQHERFLTAQEIAIGLIQDAESRKIVETAREQQQEPQSLEWLASNMVSWFSQRITVGESDWARSFQRAKLDGQWAYKPTVSKSSSVLGSREMRHFIAYHNTEKMGRSLHECDPLRLWTNKPVNHLVHNTVWFIVGDGDGSAAKQYSLGSVFRVAEAGESTEEGFNRFAKGAGHVFQPPIPITELDWFPEVLRATGHFGLGVCEMKDEAVIKGLSRLASQISTST